ncbi:MAG: Lcl C-terminal domain-containing protein [Acidiferrobacterales bacterium]
MQINDRNKKLLALGAPGVAIVGLLAFFLFHGATLLAPKTAAEPAEPPIQVKKTLVTSKVIHKIRHKKVRVARHSKTHVPAPVPQVLPVLFPKPTEITIAVAATPELVKLDSYQNPLEPDAKKWDCVKDATTGLVWEVKTRDKSLRDANNFYSWYGKSSLSQASSGMKDGGKCRGGISCDTQSYINAINAKRVCGYSDWRLPTRKELLSLVRGHNDGNQKSMIDTRFFPSTPGDWYWTADTDLGDSDHAWYVLFYNGRTMKALKSQAKRVRLVRGEIMQERSFKNVAERIDSGTNKEIAKQPFQLEPYATTRKEMLSQN